MRRLAVFVGFLGVLAACGTDPGGSDGMADVPDTSVAGDPGRDEGPADPGGVPDPGDTFPAVDPGGIDEGPAPDPGPSDEGTADPGTPDDGAADPGTPGDPGAADEGGATDPGIGTDPGVEPTDPGTGDAGPCSTRECLACRPCIDDADCNPDGGTAHRCETVGPEGRACRVACTPVGGCPAGHLCFDGTCRPKSGTCPCLPEHAAFPTVCTASNGLGTCSGLRTCDAPCPVQAPVAETCNGLDDDCDGEADDHMGFRVCGTGECAVRVPACLDGAEIPCTPGEPGPEVCNGLDDDCNGQTDDTGGVQECGLGPCRITAPECGPCVPPAGNPETCNGVDDDCDGVVDDAGPTTCGTGACTATVTGCAGGVPIPCVPGRPGVEVCNGQDDDCDGLTDEDLGTFTCGAGRCTNTVPACREGVPVPCSPLPKEPEVCNGIDDDCDLSTDEDGACPCPVVARPGGHLYLVCPQGATHMGANAVCASGGPGYRLAEVDDADENDWLRSLAGAAPKWWVGASDAAEEGTWVWTGGAAVSAGYANWGPGEPNDDPATGGEDCLALGSDGLWNDAACWVALPFLCERP